MFRILSGFWSEVKSLGLREKLLLALIFSLPFERTPSFEAAGLTIKLSLILGLALIVASVKSLNRKQILKNKLLLFPLVLGLFSLLGLAWSTDTSFWLKANLILGFNLVLFYEVYAVIRESKDRVSLLKLTLRTLLFSTGTILLFGFYQWFGNLLGLSQNLTGIRPEYATERLGLPRMHSVLLEPLYFSLFLLLPLGMLWADRTGQVLKNIYTRFSSILIIYIAILFSLARGGIVASAVIGLVGLIYNFKVLKAQLKLKDMVRIGLGLVLITALIVGATSLLGRKGNDSDNNYKKGFSTLTGHLKTIKLTGSDKDEADGNSINTRDVARTEAWKVISKSPQNSLLGVGAGQYGPNLSPERDFSATSNFVLLDVWDEYGLVGLLITLSFFSGLIHSALKIRGLSQPGQVVVLGVCFYLLGFLIQSITFGELAITHLWVSLGLVAGLLLYHSDKQKV